MWLSAIKLAMNAGTHIYKKKQEFNGGLLQYRNLKCNDFNDFAYKDNYSKLIKLN